MYLGFHLVRDLWCNPHWFGRGRVGTRGLYTFHRFWDFAGWAANTFADVEAVVLVLALLGWGAYTAAVWSFLCVRDNNA